MTFIEKLYNIYVKNSIISPYNLPLPAGKPLDFFYANGRTYHEEKDEFVLYGGSDTKILQHSDLCFSQINTLQSVLDEAKVNPLFNGAFRTEILNTREPIATFIQNPSIVRPTPCIYTGNGIDNHWIEGKGLGGKKENKKILNTFNIELREVSSEPDWHEVMYYTYCKFDDLFSASCLSSDYHRYTVYKKHNDIRDRAIFLEILKDGVRVGYVSLVRPYGIHISNASVWHYSAIICYENNLARPVATFCAQYLHDAYGDTLFHLTSGSETLYPTYQHYKMSIANVSMPFFSIDMLLTGSGGDIFANGELVDFEPLEPYYLDGRSVGTKHELVGYKMENPPSFTRFDHYPFFNKSSGQEYDRLLDFLESCSELQRGAK